MEYKYHDYLAQYMGDEFNYLDLHNINWPNGSYGFTKLKVEGCGPDPVRVIFGKVNDRTFCYPIYELGERNPHKGYSLRFNGNKDKPTCSPSILAGGNPKDGTYEWHGHLIAGKFVACE